MADEKPWTTFAIGDPPEGLVEWCQKSMYEAVCQALADGSLRIVQTGTDETSYGLPEHTPILRFTTWEMFEHDRVVPLSEAFHNQILGGMPRRYPGSWQSEELTALRQTLTEAIAKIDWFLAQPVGPVTPP